MRDNRAENSDAMSGKCPVINPIFDTNYPVDALGATADLARSLAIAFQTPVEIVAQSLLSALSLVTQCIANAQTPFGSNCPLSLCLITVAEPSARKKYVEKLIFAEIEAYEQGLQDMLIYDPQVKNLSDKSLKSKTINQNLLGSLHRAPASKLDVVIRGLSKLANSIVYSSNDLTQFVGENKSRPSPAILLANSYLDRLWFGENIIVSQGSTAQLLRGRRVAVSLNTSPESASDVLRIDRSSAQSLLSKALVSWPKSIVGDRNSVEVDPSKINGLEDFNNRCISLLTKADFPPGSDSSQLSARVLKLDGEERKTLLNFLNQVEEHSGDSQYFAKISAFSENSAEHICRIAGVLQIYADPKALRIDAEHLKSAMELFSYYALQMYKLQENNSLADGEADANWLLLWLQNNYRKHLNVTGTEIFKVRYIQQNTHLPLRKADVIQKSLEILHSRRVIFFDKNNRLVKLLREDAQE